ncbi:hypothetical protein BU15DRAFT_49217 [Melanogaster broomeanus]|nr:hypothetical protein BU15DRAFT_49217 [Melanogaster broomeanus]
MAPAVVQSSWLCRLPLEIIEEVVLELHDDPTNPPSMIPPLLQTCKQLYNSLGFKTNNHLYARLFVSRFDGSAAARRLGELGSNAPGLSYQLRSYCSALKCLRTGDIHANDIPRTFWICFSMMMENDGKNRCQLEAAGLPDFVDRFVRERLYENNEAGWPAESEVNSLAMWLLWFTSTEERLRAETPEQRAQMTKLILPYVLMPVRYAAYFAPHTHFTLPLSLDTSQHPHSFHTVHGIYPQYREGRSWKTPLYEVKDLEVGVPLASVAAKLVYFSRREVSPVGVPPHLPRTREHAFQLGLTMVGPTQEDVQELNEHKIAKLVPETTWDWWSKIKGYDHLRPEELAKRAPSARWDNDWSRLVDCNHLFAPISLKRPHYTPGQLRGLWQGRMLYPDDNLYGTLMQTPEMPASFDEQTIGLAAAPVFMRLREYHCMDVEPHQPIPGGGKDGAGGIQNAWFPNSMRYQEVSVCISHHGLTITCQERTSFYHEYVVGGPDLHDESKCRGCQYRGTSEMVLREHDDRYLQCRYPDAQYVEGSYLEALDQALAEDGMEEGEDEEDDAMEEDSSEADVEMNTDGELEIKRKCDGIRDIVLVGETDMRHGHAWHHYKFYGRVREWDGLVALIRIPVMNPHVLGVWIFTGYVIGGQNFVGNWRTTTHPGEPVTFDAGETTIIIAGKLFDPYSLDLVEKQLITVSNESGLILEVSPYSGSDPLSEWRFATENVIDLSTLTVLPGFVDAHVHFFLHPYSETSWEDQLTKESIVERTIRATVHAKRTLMAGYTAVRDLGTEGAGDADIALRKCLSSGEALVPGPRYFCASRAIVPTGSYGPKSSLYVNQEGIDGITGAEVADGRDECSKAVRRQIGAGADWIKVSVSQIFGVSTRPGGASMSTFNHEELKTMIDTAHQYGVKVAAHATNKDTIDHLIRLSVDSIEHGYDIASSDDRETLRAFAQSNTKWVPTLAAYFTLSQGAGGSWERAAQSFKAALEEGVDNIACGGDTGVFAHGDNAMEMALMVRLGADWRRVLKWGTLGGWECVRSMEWEGRKGTERLASVGELREDPSIVGDNEVPFGAVRKGFAADLIATSGNFATDFQGAVSAENIKFVMKGGRVYKRDGVALV